MTTSDTPMPAIPARSPADERLSVEVAGLSAAYDSAEVLRGVDLGVAPGEIVALLGPSGCGKTTLLRCIAGLEAPTAGTITVGDRVVSAPGKVEAPERRRVGMVFQDGALFPHLSVADNVAYGLPRAQRQSSRVSELLEMVGLAGYEPRLPGTLSGGQQQRVALARALAPHPAVLLLDEPFSSLDTGLRVQVRAEVHRLLREIGVTTIFVTHDQEEAFLLGERVAVLRDGTLEQVGTPIELYDRPASAWVAGFVGEANLVGAEARGTSATTPCGEVPLRVPATGSVEVLLRPEHLRLAAGGEAVVESVEYYGHDTRYVVRLPDGQEVATRMPGAPAHRAGDPVTPQPAIAQAESWPASGTGIGR